MLIIPAIDIKDGRAVRLEQGDMAKETVFSDDPAAVARHWLEQGARRLHLVDLNGAVAGKPRNESVIKAIVSAVGGRIPIQLGGGIRDLDTVERYLDDGIRYVDLGSLAEALTPDTAVVSVMTANNETGVAQPLDAVSAIVSAHVPGGTTLHTDAVAAAPWMHLPTVTATADLVSICAHKIGGPVNAGALVMRGDVALDAVVPGGGQEHGLRGGTVDVAAAVGLAAAPRATSRRPTITRWTCDAASTWRSASCPVPWSPP